MITLNVAQVEENLRDGLAILSKYIPLSLAASHPRKQDLQIEFVKAREGFSVERLNRKIIVCYEQTNQAFRGLGLVIGKMRAGKPLVSLKETQQFSLINVMLDVSRNAAVKPEKLKELLARFALMGINSFMLYSECNFEVPGEPLWGYNLGGYSMAELRDLDRYAQKLGIEMFPCIQTLGHLKRVIQWPHYNPVTDTVSVLLAGEQKTYELLDRVIAAASAPYASKRIHIGMDEASDLGLGAYLLRHGYKSHHELMKLHLGKIMRILRKYRLKPMMWSDMFFVAGSKHGDYYDLKGKLLGGMKKAIPRDMALVYWDYYHEDVKFYKTMIDRHVGISGRLPIIATGAHTSRLFWADYPYAFHTIDPCMAACKQKGVKELIMTVWGDDSTECDYYSILPVMQYYADHAFCRSIPRDTWKDNLLGSCDIVYKEWRPAGEIDAPPKFTGPGRWHCNPSKFLLWEDPFYGLTQPLFGKASLSDYYRSIASQLKRNARIQRRYNQRLLFPAQLAKILGVKCDFPRRLYDAYHKGDKRCLNHLLRVDMPFLRTEFMTLWKMHRELWLNTYKAQGWETLECRYGGMIFRLETLDKRIRQYLNGEIQAIDELEGKRLNVFNQPKGRLPMMGHDRCYTATFMPVN